MGFKPTRQLISSEGLIFASQGQDTVGVLSRTVTDAMFVLLGIILESAHHSSDSKRKLVQDLGSSCSRLELSGIRIGVPGGTQRLPECKTEAFRCVLSSLKSAGAVIVTNVKVTGVQVYEQLSTEQKQVVLDADMKVAINNYLSSLATNPNNIYDLQDLIDFTKCCPEEAYPRKNVEVLVRAQASNRSSTLYQSMMAKDEYFAGNGGIAYALNQYHCAVLLVPVLSVPLQTLAAKAGSPVISIPIGLYPPETVVKLDDASGLVEVAPGIP